MISLLLGNERLMDFSWIKQLALSLTTYLASVTIILLSFGRNGIVNNRNILTDSRDEIKYLKKNTMNYDNCRFIHDGNMILLFQT